MLNFLKTKKFIIGVVVAILFLIIFYGKFKKDSNIPIYEFAKAQRGIVVQTVDATGKIESLNDLSLRFETAGTLDVIKVKEGDVATAGSLLANLKLAELDAAVAAARANLNQKIAGATDQEKNYYEAAVSAAKASWDQSKIDTQNSISTAESAVETARNNLKLAEGGEESRIVVGAYEDAVALLITTVSVLDNALSQIDNILGIDNTLANDSFEDQLSNTNPSKLNQAEDAYLLAKIAKDSARSKILPLTITSSHQDIDAALREAEIASAKMTQALVAVADVLNATLSGNNLTQTVLESKKSTIETTRAATTANYTNIINQKQIISDAKNSYDTYLIAFNKAMRDLEDTKSSAATTLIAKEAAYNQASANLQTKTVSPREVDLAYSRAILAQAEANRDKAILKSPIDGVVTKVNKKRGEFVSMSDVVISILSPHYEIKVDVPETDVAKIKVGDPASVTLDAFGEDVKFTGKIMSIEPASTDVQDVVYYKVTVSLDETAESIKPGMTANVNVTTGIKEDVLFIPLRAVRTGEDKKYVRILSGGKEAERTVDLGLKGDGGMVEIISGLKEGEEIIISVRSVN